MSLKKIIYILLTILLVEMCGFIFHEIVSVEVLKVLVRNGMSVTYFHIAGFLYSPLPSYLFWGIATVGAFGGIFLALRWWTIVYIEHRHWKDWYGRR